MGEESETISKNTWARVVEPVCKMGYMDGASDGQTATFQSSFDIGYEQGLNFGIEFGYRDALLCIKERRDFPTESPSQGVNCQVCVNEVSAQENIGNLYNLQKERNAEYLLHYKKTC